MQKNTTLVLASSNAGKLAEFSQILQPLGWQVRPQADFSIPDADETGLTFVENALIKARHAAQLSGCAALADDSGLEVDALNGAPGIYSARFAGPGAQDAQNNALLLERLAAYPETERTARYWCVLVLMRHAEDPTPIIVQQSWSGRILTAPQGEGGFGYDPLFWLPDLQMTAAELSAAEKNRLSHRGRALQALLSELHKREG